MHDLTTFTKPPSTDLIKAGGYRAGEVEDALIVAGDHDQSMLSVRGPDWFTDGYRLSPGPADLLTLCLSTWSPPRFGPRLMPDTPLRGHTRRHRVRSSRHDEVLAQSGHVVEVQLTLRTHIKDTKIGRGDHLGHQCFWARSVGHPQTEPAVQLGSVAWVGDGCCLTWARLCLAIRCVWRIDGWWR